MKLNIEYIPKPNSEPEVEPVDKYKNPIGIWEVTTEGDCEGRSTENLGVWRGHVAKIAFHLADKCYYTLRFRSLSGTRTMGVNVPDKIKTNRKYVWISFDIKSKTWDMKPEKRAEFIADFLDVKDQLNVYGRYDNCQYFAGSCLVLKN